MINVSTHIDNEYVDETELKILIHKKINEISSYDSFCAIKNELEDRFGKLSEKMIIYMYEEWFEKLAKSFGIDNVIDNDKMVDIVLPACISNNVKGDELFTEVYNINHNFKLNYKNNEIHIILEKRKLEQHYLMYLIAVLIKLRKLID